MLRDLSHNRIWAAQALSLIHILHPQSSRFAASRSWLPPNLRSHASGQSKNGLVARRNACRKLLSRVNLPITEYLVIDDRQMKVLGKEPVGLDAIVELVVMHTGIQILVPAEIPLSTVHLKVRFHCFIDIPVSYTHLDVYKRQAQGRRSVLNLLSDPHSPGQPLKRILNISSQNGFSASALSLLLRSRLRLFIPMGSGM